MDLSSATSNSASVPPIFEGTTGLFLGDDDQLGHQETQPGSPNPNLHVEKEGQTPLPSRIADIFYINNYGMRVYPRPNPRFITALAERDFLVYSCGSLFTSLMPCLALKGVGGAIARSKSLKHRVLLLNSLHDRETLGMSATDFVWAITKCLNHTLSDQEEPHVPSSFMWVCLLLIRC